MKFSNKSNESFEMDDINEFCGEHELDIKALRKVINREMKTHRGFRLAEPKLEKPIEVMDNSVVEKLIKDNKLLMLSLSNLEQKFEELNNKVAPILKERMKAEQRREEEQGPRKSPWTSKNQIVVEN